MLSCPLWSLGPVYAREQEVQAGAGGRAPKEAGRDPRGGREREGPHLTNFSHHPQALLIVGATSSDKDGDLMLLQGALVIANCSHDALEAQRDRQTGDQK